MDACVLSGSKCGQAAADAFCQYLGFDYNAPGLYSTIQATAPALSMTGQYLAIGLCVFNEGLCIPKQSGPAAHVACCFSLQLSETLEVLTP